MPKGARVARSRGGWSGMVVKRRGVMSSSAYTNDRPDGWQDALELEGCYVSSRLRDGWAPSWEPWGRRGCWARLEWTALPKCGPVRGRVSAVHGSSFDKGGGGG